MKQPNHRQSAVGMRQFFEWLEQRFGGSLPMDQGRAGQVIVKKNRLEAADLQRLFSHEATALHVKQFYPKQSAIELGAQLAQQAKQGQGRNWKVGGTGGTGLLESSDVFTLGAHEPYNVAVANQTTDEYYQQVQTEFQQRRREMDRDDSTSAKAKTLWPLDQFRLALDEVWPYGAGLARGTGSDTKEIQNEWCRGGGLPRVMMGPTRWKKGFVHVDEMAPLNASDGFFSANIYLQIPSLDENGSSTQKTPSTAQPKPVLEIWPLGIRSRWDWYRNAHTLSALSSQDAEGQVLLRKVLGEPHRIEVEPGDLILLCVQRPHAAIGFTQADSIRVSLQCFLQYSGTNQKLEIES